VEVRELQTVCCKRINVWRIDVRSEAAHLGETGVVKKNEDDVWGVGARVSRSWKPCLRLGQRASDFSFKSVILSHGLSYYLLDTILAGV
jgi:hypothetical protein